MLHSFINDPRDPKQYLKVVIINSKIEEVYFTGKIIDGLLFSIEDEKKVSFIEDLLEDIFSNLTFLPTHFATELLKGKKNTEGKEFNFGDLELKVSEKDEVKAVELRTSKILNSEFLSEEKLEINKKFSNILLLILSN